MDAHLFRRFCEDLTPQLTGARVEKLQEPTPGLLILTWYGGGRKRQLSLRHARKEPFCFTSSSRISAGKAPSAQIMRLRKYASGRRILSCVVRFYDRQLWLLLAGGDSMTAGTGPGDAATPDSPRLTWLLLDLREGPSLHFLTEAHAPENEQPQWPEPAQLEQARQNWREWPVLTPALRRTLACLEEPEQWALLEDLRAGGGDVFCYGPASHVTSGLSADMTVNLASGIVPDLASGMTTDLPTDLPPNWAGGMSADLPTGLPPDFTSGTAVTASARFVGTPTPSGNTDACGNPLAAIRAISAWPLPPELRAGLLTKEELASGLLLREVSSPDALGLTEKAGHDMVLARLAGEQAREAALPLDRRGRKLSKLLDKLREEENRLKTMTKAQADALALQENLWQWPADYRAANVMVGEGGHGPAREIRLDPRRNVREEMARLFHTARRGWRGLEHMVQRRSMLEEEMAAIAIARRDRMLGVGSAQDGDRQSIRRGPAGAAAGMLAALPKSVQLFVSSDGFALLRGRDAKGNLAARKLAAPHDIWLHAENGPGAHVIIRRAHGGQEVPARTLDEAGSLAASKSWQKDAAHARIQYAEVRHVKPMRNAPAGTVRIDRILASREVPVDATLEEKLLPD